MEISAQQFAGIAHCFPLQRGNVSLPNRQVLNAILYMMTHDCAWRDLPEHFGHWHTVYTRMNRWAKAGVLTDRDIEFLSGEVARANTASAATSPGQAADEAIARGREQFLARFTQITQRT